MTLADSVILSWLRQPYRNSLIIGTTAILTGLALVTRDLAHNVEDIGAIPASLAGILLVFCGSLTLLFNRIIPALAVASLVGLGAIIGIIAFALTVSALQGETSGITIPIVFGFLGLTATTAADLLGEWGERKIMNTGG